MIPFSKHTGFIYENSDAIRVDLRPEEDINSFDADFRETEEALIANDSYLGSHLHYWVTESVVKNLEFLKIDKLDWSVFKNLPLAKKSFYLPDNTFLRVMSAPGVILIMTIYQNYLPGLQQNIFGINRVSGEIIYEPDKELVENLELIYKIMCFIFLAENEEIIVPPRHRYGTRKTGKVVNESSSPLIIVNSKWNITSIRTEGFGVRGHFAIRWTGKGRMKAELVLIPPFEKHGYIRKAKRLCA